VGPRPFDDPWPQTVDRSLIRYTGRLLRGCMLGCARGCANMLTVGHPADLDHRDAPVAPAAGRV